MTQQGVRWTAEQVLALAPDAASRKAGSKLGAAGPWSERGQSDEGAVWGLCKGSGSKPYQTVVDIADAAGPAYKCSCPSRKFPCKHALGLLLLWAGGGRRGAGGGEPPDWAEEWLAGRRRARGARSGRRARTGRPAGRRPLIRRRRGAGRSGGPSGSRRARRSWSSAWPTCCAAAWPRAEQAGYGLWEETAARMVDAQAPGLAARVRELGAIPASGPGWPVRLLEECALLHLLDQGWLRRERLPGRAWRRRSARAIGLPGLRRTARRSGTAGWSSPSTTRRTAG